MMDISITGFGALERRVYKIFSTGQDLLIRHALYELSLSLSHDVELQYISIITLYPYPYFKSFKLVNSVQWVLHVHIKSSLHNSLKSKTGTLLSLYRIPFSRE